MDSPVSRRPERGAARLVPIVSIVVVGLLVFEVGLLVLPGTERTLSVRISGLEYSGDTATVTLQVSNGLLPSSVHLALVPSGGSAASDPTILYFSDASYHPLYGSIGDIDTSGTRLASYLALMHSPDQVDFVNGAGLPAQLELHPHGTLVFVGTGVLPDFVYSQNSTLLAYWLQNGGTLIWAGGPLGYTAGHPTSGGGFFYDNLGWLGELKLAGFALSDSFDLSDPAPGSAGPGYAPTATALASALQLSYGGAFVGANVTQVQAHQGVVLGNTAPGLDAASAESPRASTAFVPVGRGGLLYFGAGLYEAPLGFVPDGSVELCQDIATWLSLPRQPTNGPVTEANVNLTSYQQSSVSLSVPLVDGDYIALARSQLQGSQLTFWSGVVPLNGTGVGVGTFGLGALSTAPVGILAAAGVAPLVRYPNATRISLPPFRD